MINEHQIKIKISGCPNSCGQHGIATIGFHGSSIKNGAYLLPAIQVLLGGNVGLGGKGRIAEKVIKIPSKRGPEALRQLLDDYEANALDGEYYSDYYARQGKMYFYQLLKPLANLETLENDHYLDWGHTDTFSIQKAVGECAGVIIDLVATLLYETEEKVEWAHLAFSEEKYSDAIFHAYSVFINGAKALLLATKSKTNTQNLVIKNFAKEFGEDPLFKHDTFSFEEWVLQIQKEAPTKEFAEKYINDATDFLGRVKHYREAITKKVEA